MNRLNTQSVPSIKKSIIELEVPEPGSSRFKEIAAKLLCDLLKECRMTKDASYIKMNASRRKIYLHVVPDHHPSHIKKQHEVTLRVVEDWDLESGLQKPKTYQDSGDHSDSFIKNVHRIITENFKNPQFQIGDLASQLCMSRTQLYRRLKASTGKSFTMIQRDLKVNKACELLKSNDLTVSEISYKLGFKDPSYMSRIFKKEKKVSPSRFQTICVSGRHSSI